VRLALRDLNPSNVLPLKYSQIPSSVRSILSPAEMAEWLHEQRMYSKRLVYKVDSTVDTEASVPFTLLAAAIPLTSDDTIYVETEHPCLDEWIDFMLFLSKQSEILGNDERMNSLQVLLSKESVCGDSTFVRSLVKMESFLHDHPELLQRFSSRRRSTSYRTYWCAAANIAYFAMWLKPHEEVEISINFTIYWPKRYSVVHVTADPVPELSSGPNLARHEQAEFKFVSISGRTISDREANEAVAGGNDHDRLRSVSRPLKNVARGDIIDIPVKGRHTTSDLQSWKQDHLSTLVLHTVKDIHTMMVIITAWIALSVLYYILRRRRRGDCNTFGVANTVTGVRSSAVGTRKVWMLSNLIDVLFMLALLISLFLICLFFAVY
jgi:hypothetical protein